MARAVLAFVGLMLGCAGLSLHAQSNEWTWMGGNSTDPASCTVLNDYCAHPGVYGTQGTPASGNIPGARRGAVGWTDASGNLWMFGGSGNDSTALDQG